MSPGLLGILTDAGFAGFLFFRLILFSIGVSTCLRTRLGMVWGADLSSTPLSFSVGLCALLALSVILSPFGVPLLPLLSAMVLLVQTVGAVSLWKSFRGGISIRAEGIVVFFWQLGWLGVWAWALADVDGLMSAHDGIAHTVFVDRLMEQLQLSLPQTKIGFTAEFGPGFFRFYPYGTHVLISILEWPWVSVLGGMYPTSEVLKAWLLCATGFLFLLIWKVLKDAFPTIGFWPRWAATFLIPGYFIYPVQQVSSGGLSRQIATVILIPVLVHSVRSHRLVGLSGSLALPVVSFLLHPASLIAAGSAWLWNWIRVRAAWTSGLAFLLGVLGLVLVLWFMGALNHAGTAIVLPPASLRGSLGAAYELAKLALDDASYGWPNNPVLAREILVLAFLLGVASVPRPILTWVLYSTVLVSSVFVLRGTGLSPFEFLARLVYFDPGRAVELLYPVLIVVWLYGAVILVNLLEALCRSKHRIRQMTGGILALCWVASCAWDVSKTVLFLRSHVEVFQTRYHGPSRAEDWTRIQKLRQRSTKSAVLVSDPGKWESLRFRVPMATLFAYHECPFSDSGENCSSRAHFLEELDSSIRKCQPPPAPFKDRPVFRLVSPTAAHELERFRTCPSWNITELDGNSALMQWRASKTVEH